MIICSYKYTYHIIKYEVFIDKCIQFKAFLIMNKLF